MSYICIDIGGMSIKYGILEKNGDIKVMGNIATRVTDTKNYILEDVENLVKELIVQYKEYKIEGICVSTAGVVDPVAGKIVFAGPTIPKYQGTEIKKTLEKKFNIPCEVENDVNCAGLGEYWLGAGKGTKSMVCITIGTGIGGSIILDGKLLNGIGYTAGEIGYMNINGRAIQDIASAKVLVDNVIERKKEKNENINGITGLKIFELAKAGDRICIDALDELIENLSIALGNIIYLVNPEVIVIGGGIANQKQYLEERIQNKVNEKLVGDIFKKTKIKMAKQGNDAGMIGALYHFLTK